MSRAPWGEWAELEVELLQIIAYLSPMLVNSLVFQIGLVVSGPSVSQHDRNSGVKVQYWEPFSKDISVLVTELLLLQAHIFFGMCSLPISLIL